jgi:hypothetical protein
LIITFSEQNSDVKISNIPQNFRNNEVDSSLYTLIGFDESEQTAVD